MDAWNKKDWKRAMDSPGSEDEQEAYRHLGKYLFPTAMKILGQEELAREFVQQSLLNVFEAYSSFKWKCHIKTYAVSILRNEIYQYFRKPGTKKEISVNFQEPEDKENADFISFLATSLSQNSYDLPEALIEKDELRQAIIDALNELSDLQRTALIEYAIHNKSAAEVADLLQISISALHQNVSRARKFIKEYVKSLGY